MFWLVFLENLRHQKGILKLTDLQAKAVGECCKDLLQLLSLEVPEVPFEAQEVYIEAFEVLIEVQEVLVELDDLRTHLEGERIQVQHKRLEIKIIFKIISTIFKKVLEFSSSFEKKMS